MNHIEATKLALDALELECMDSDGNKIDLVTPAITALRQAIEQAEKQEPVAFLMDGELFTIAEYEVIAEQGDGAQPLYVAPPKREFIGLTDEEIDLAIKDCKTTDTYKYFRAIEAKLREKNGF